MAARGNSAAAADYELIHEAGEAFLESVENRAKNSKAGEIELISKAKLPTRFGIFTIYGFLDHRDGKEHTAMVHGEVGGAEACPVRIHSECHTGDIWFSMRCDCREQLEASLKYVNSQERGVIIYLRQEGRGIGLLNKLKAYDLQDRGLDTVEANNHLGFPTDARSYEAAANIIRLLGIDSVALITNNPEKIEGLKKNQITVTERIPVIIPSNLHNKRYLRTKKERLGHLLDA
ncbi:MAG: GTP cyclohydrolase II [Spirochaetaceae bacterium]|nr:MAG: GTP cyclohydrolase II [Spirochaetaceae bacterium]